MTPQERSDRARLLLKDPVLAEALDGLRNDVVAKLEASGMDDVDTHHQAALTLQLLKSLRVKLERFVGDSVMAVHKEQSDRFIDRMRQKVRP